MFNVGSLIQASQEWYLADQRQTMKMHKDCIMLVLNCEHYGDSIFRRFVLFNGLVYQYFEYYQKCLMICNKIQYCGELQQDV